MKRVALIVFCAALACNALASQAHGEAGTPSPAQAQADEKSPIEAFRITTESKLYLCTLMGRVTALSYQLKSAKEVEEAEANLVKCINEGEQAVRSVYGGAKMQAEEAGARAELKNYYAVWLSALRSLRLRQEDTQVSYKRRITTNEQRVEDAWAVFDVEMVR